jgi:fluoroquinolone transport system ATP-binding protein
LHDPELLFLDEPTAGLDPVNARILKDMVEELKAQGKTIFLTTHNMWDADELCDRIAFINEGEIAIIDSPRNLKLAHGTKTVDVEYSEDGASHKQSFPLEGLGANETFQKLLKAEAIETIHSKEATLEDVFIKVTGRTLR